MTDLTRRRLLTTVARLPLLAAASQLPLARVALAQAPEDPVADAILSYAGTIPTLSGMIFAPVVEAHRVFAQSELAVVRLSHEDAYMTALTTNTLADLDKNVRMAAAGGQRAYALVEQDIAWWRDRYNRITIPNATLSAPEQTAKARHDALVELKAELDRVQLKPLADRMVQVFDRARNALTRMGGTPQAERVANMREVAAIMAEFARVGAYVDGLLPAVREFGWPLTPDQWRDATQPTPPAGGPALPPPTGPLATPPAATTQTPRRRAVNPFPGQQVRLSLENTSTTLVFFARLHSLQPDRSYQLRDDTRYWLPIYPKDATMPAAAGSGSSATPVPLSNKLWLPAKPGDKIELRVATYGEHRQRIRWLVVRGQQVRPTIDGLSRGFYWLSYELRRSDRPGDQLTTRLFPTREGYQWRLNGLWEGSPPTGADLSATPVGELRTQPAQTYPLAVERDHLTWTMPTGMETIRGGPTLQATVEGSATFSRVGPNSNQRVDNLTEAGTGDLIIQMQEW